MAEPERKVQSMQRVGLEIVGTIQYCRIELASKCPAKSQRTGFRSKIRQMAHSCALLLRVRSRSTRYKRFQPVVRLVS